MDQTQTGIFVLFIISVFVSVDLSNAVGGCRFAFQTLDWNVTARSDADIGDFVHGIYIEDVIEGTDFDGTLSMLPQTEYFEVNGRDIIVQGCLPSGLKETLEIKMDGTSCKPSYLYIEVVPTIPALKTAKFAADGPGGLPSSGTADPLIPDGEEGSGDPGVSNKPQIPALIPQQYEIMVNNCSTDATISVFHIEFFNDGSCVSFNCSVNCTNDEKKFWMVDETELKTDTTDMKFNFTYALSIVCQESGAQLLEKYSGSDAFNVTFFNACPMAEYKSLKFESVSPSKVTAATSNGTVADVSGVSGLTTSSSSLEKSSHVNDSPPSIIHSSMTFTISPATLFSLSASKQSSSPGVNSGENNHSTVAESSRLTTSNSFSLRNGTMSLLKSEVTDYLMYSKTKLSEAISTTQIQSVSLLSSPSIGSTLLTSFPAEERVPPINIAVISAATGTAVLAVVGVSLYTLATRRCKFISLRALSGKVNHGGE